MAHAPSGLVGATDLSLDLLGGDPVAGTCHEVHREQPTRQRGPRFIEDRLRARKDVMPAMLGGVAPSRADSMKLGINLAAGADELGSAVSDLHDSRQARAVVGEFGLKLFECVSRGVAPSLVIWGLIYLMSGDNRV